jgi:hypothetical protein
VSLFVIADQVRAEKSQFESYKKDMARIQAEEKARNDLMHEVMSIREVQISNKRIAAEKEKIEDKIRVQAIKVQLLLLDMYPHYPTEFASLIITTAFY